MRALRTTVVVGLVVLSLAMPALVAAQTEVGPAVPTVPLARQPDGKLPLAGTPWRLRSYRHDGRAAEPV